LATLFVLGSRLHLQGWPAMSWEYVLVGVFLLRCIVMQITHALFQLC
jgi:hypothetical protein